MTEKEFLELIKRLIQDPNDLKKMLQGYLDQKQEEFNKSNSKSYQNQIVILENNKEILEMKGITKTKDGRYTIRLQKNKKRITKYAKTKELAIKIYKQLKNLKDFNIRKKQIVKKYTVYEWYLKWLKDYKENFISKKSFIIIKSALNKIIPNFKDILITELTTEQIQSALNKLPHNRTKERIYTYFNALLQKAYDIKLIDRNQFNAVVKEKKIKYKSICYSIDEQTIILNEAKKYNIEHEIMIYLMCGCRPNELPTKENFDFKNNIINIYGTKNDNALHREIEMSQSFSDYIKKYFENNETKKEKFISKQFSQLCKDNNISDSRLYRLRHTFATNHFTLGTPVKYVQSWLGHYSAQLTLDIYTDIDKKSSKEKIKKLYNNFYYEI